MIRRAALAMVMLLAASAAMAQAEDPAPPRVTIGSKMFTESVILAEIAGHLARNAGARVDLKDQLGGTRVVWEALVRGEIDIYPEYTGTLVQEILAGQGIRSVEDLPAALAAREIAMTRPLGFNNTYAIGMMPDRAAELGITKVSDLARHPDLKLGFSIEFMDREDGWPALRARYGLTHPNARGLEHDLAYRALASGGLDAIDVYTTDAEIPYYELAVLDDDLDHFPAYEAVILYRVDLKTRAPAVAQALEALGGRIDARTMAGLNARAKLDGEPANEIAADFVNRHLEIAVVAESRGWWRQLWRNTVDHLVLVGLSLGAAVLVALPLGISAARYPRFGQIVLGVVGIIQTIPSLALFVFMIPLLGIGGPPAVMALFLYSLLPIVRNTYAGLTDISSDIRESAAALGLSSGARLRLVELPMAGRAILAGIKIAAVINVGTATLGALIGAGGYGQPILTGIRLDDTALILSGAVPAAVLALAVQGLFEIVERITIPKGLRLKPGA